MNSAQACAYQQKEPLPTHYPVPWFTVSEVQMHGLGHFQYSCFTLLREMMLHLYLKVEHYF